MRLPRLSYFFALPPGFFLWCRRRFSAFGPGPLLAESSQELLLQNREVSIFRILFPIRPLNEGNGIWGGTGLRGEDPYPSLPKEVEKGSTETFVPVPLGVGWKTLPVRGPVPICLPSVMVAAAGRWAIRA